VVLDADWYARQAVRPGTDCWLKLRELLGEDFFARDGELQRRKLRNRILEDDRCRREIDAILHPCIMEAMEHEWQRRLAGSPQNLIIFDIPLLFEAKIGHRFDTIILVYAPAEIQIQRLVNRDKVSRRQAEQTLLMQLPIESKKEKAHIIIDNSADLEHTRRQVAEVWQRLSTVKRQ
ncbi:MAG: dephospho-CoA kinase, partial [Desulforhabdus sp.]|nr:dephospho-CoA kinase [Desulforhabdus sp.]